MRFKQVLDKVFSQPTGIRILRFMVLFRPEMTGREIARQCGISHMMAYRALNIFESQGIVKKSRIGRSSLYRINEDNILINSF